MTESKPQTTDVLAARVRVAADKKLGRNTPLSILNLANQWLPSEQQNTTVEWGVDFEGDVELYKSRHIAERNASLTGGRLVRVTTTTEYV